jgi:RNA polymerase-binding protein DksA
MPSKQKQSSAAAHAGSSNFHSEQRARQLCDLLAAVRSQETQWMRAMREPSSPEDATLGDEGDCAVSSKDRELTACLAQLAGSRVAAVQDALERLREGRYGTCEECEEEIPLERLKAMPSTVLCVDCQRKRETAARRAPADMPALWVAPKEPPPIGSDQPDPTAKPQLPTAQTALRAGGVDGGDRILPKPDPCEGAAGSALAAVA